MDTSTSSPLRLPKIALPTGDSLEIRLLNGSASEEPTITYSNSSLYIVSNTVTLLPTDTTSPFVDSSIILAVLILFSNSEI